MEKSAWDLILNKEYREACISADVEYRSTKSLLALRNKVYALLLMKDYSQAIAQSSEIIVLDHGEADSDFLFRGVAHWVMSQSANAISDWKSALSTKYTDASGGCGAPLLLFYASIKLKDEALKQQVLQQLKILSKKKASTNWPGPLVNYILGKYGQEGVYEGMSGIRGVQERQECQAHFYFGLSEQAKGNDAAFLEEMQRCFSSGANAVLKPEYYLARFELCI